MTNTETVDFIDCVSHGECYVQLHGKVYMCDGPSRYPDGRHHLCVMEIDPASCMGIRDMLLYASSGRDDCMKHFIEDKYWDGKSFWEVAPDSSTTAV